MTHSTSKNGLTRTLVRSAALVGVAAALALPVFASAATYAYVNTSGEVRTVVANDWQSAIATAPSIHARSGVIIITSPSDDIVGNDVSGI
ncbi:MAG: hypothetical protein KBC38_02380 [Candidatus Pacebacteria bacterium]|nr:hypothetical protein [Candidatus Paceibacterota bacterium]MBP9840628.1 hypothetical protein [Candidatus Paceibacterota bacterium]